MKGKIKFFNIDKGYGVIQDLDKQSNEYFVHYSDVEGDAKILLIDEVVFFEATMSPKGPQAKNIKRETPRFAGTIEKFENGFGYATVLNSTETYLVLPPNLLPNKHGRTKTIEVGFEIEFSAGISDKGKPMALDIVFRDTRNPLQRFALFEDWNEAFTKLAMDGAQQEAGHWDYYENKQQNFPVLKSYIINTFIRLCEEDKIEYAVAPKTEYACFNTGLVTEKQESIFAYFELNKRLSSSDSYLKAPKYKFLCFDKLSNRIQSNFSKEPELANYFQNASQLIYDRDKRLIPDLDHILDDNSLRFKDSLKDLSKEGRANALKSAIDAALRRVRRNYKTAIPQFYQGEIQLLLPLCISTPEKADVALVVANEGAVYRANTILPLDWAYNNARLLARPDREWLNP